MPRLPRLHLQGVIYFVTLDGPSDELLFRDPSDYAKYLDLLKKYKSEYRFKLFSYSLLPNRLHLVIEVDERFPLSVIMQKITPQYTKYYNSKYQRSGHLFSKRFRSVIVEKETYLPSLTKYLHALAKFIGIVSDFNYPHSSYSYYRHDALPSSVSMDLSEEVTEVFGSFQKSDAYLAYQQYMALADEAFMEEMEKVLARPIAGSDDFVLEIRKKISTSKQETPQNQIHFNELAPIQPRSRKPVRVPVVAGLLVSVALSVYAVSLNYPLFSLKSPNAPIVSPSQQPLNRIELNVNEEATGDLNGTVWEVELISVSSDGTKRPIKDKIAFNGRSFKSYYFSSQGFSPSNYTVNVQNNGLITWETMQTNERGERVSWRGDREGKKMDGVLSYQGTGHQPQDFSFMSSRGVQNG